MKNKKILIILAVIVIAIGVIIAFSASNGDGSVVGKNGSAADQKQLAAEGDGVKVDINLKKFVESPTIMEKSWTTLGINEIKTKYDVNSEKRTAKVPYIGDEELWISYSGDDVTKIDYIGGKEVEIYNEMITVSNETYRTNIKVSSDEIEKGQAVSDDVKLKGVTVNVLTLSDDIPEENKPNIIDRAGEFFPYLKEKKALTVEDVLISLGMKEVDTGLFDAIENEKLYEAEYVSDLGNIKLEYFPVKENLETIRITFKDNDSEYKEIEIRQTSKKLGIDNYSQFTVSINKK